MTMKVDSAGLNIPSSDDYFDGISSICHLDTGGYPGIYHVAYAKALLACDPYPLQAHCCEFNVSPSVGPATHILTTLALQNQIKAQAREHERFRRICVSMAQGLHRVDMRLRLGLLRDSASAERRSAAEAAARKHKPTSPTAKTEAQAKAEEEALAKAKAVASEADKPAPKPHIRPLSESKAIESGASVISEGFLFLVAGGLIVYESMRSRRKETTRREDVESRLAELELSERSARKALVALEKELLQQKGSSSRILPREVWEVEQKEKAQETQEEGWFSQVSSWATSLWEEGVAAVSKASGNAEAGSQPGGSPQSDAPSPKPVDQNNIHTKAP